jgi:hypothetical protein
MTLSMQYFCHQMSSTANVLCCAAALLISASACARAGDDSDGKARSPAGQSAQNDARTAEVKAFVERYFRTWSNGEMDAYGEGFLPGATIQFIDPQGTIDTQGVREFLANQRRFQAARPAKESPLSIEIRFENRLARAVVHWKLESGPGPAKFGYDHFTLFQHDGKWRIVNLAFYETDAPK